MILRLNAKRDGQDEIDVHEIKQRYESGRKKTRVKMEFKR